MFRKLLIANRGEVAARVARACKGLGISSVALASEADRDCSWLREADEVVPLGKGPPKDSYLQRERIVQAAVQTGATAVHPGWGFLAEDPLFAALCAQHGLSFIGPPPEVMERMGLKSPAKAAMAAAGLNPIPGSNGLLADVEEAVRCAERIGYPVLAKADSGGGGRGMRLCHDEAGLREGFQAAAAEAEAAFGSGAMYLERYLAGGRHIEVQVLADAFGHAVHLFERDCSVQRNHQKLIEESPSPALDENARRELGQRAAEATAAIGYVGAGTIEFLMAEDGSLYFMEMNTRLQVEHPVTEMVTGVDLVAAQIRVAANERLSLRSEDVELDGHALECRINAEDPTQNFRPTPGTLERFEFATDQGPGTVRIDTHLAQGDRIPPNYDSLLAKVIVHAPTRDEAIDTMLATLRHSRIEGVSTTIPLHLTVLDHPDFRAGNYDTRAIPGWPPAS